MPSSELVQLRQFVFARVVDLGKMVFSLESTCELHASQNGRAVFDRFGLASNPNEME